MVGKHAAALLAGHGTAEQVLEVVAVIDVVAQYQGRQVVADKVFANQKGLGQPVRRGLHGVTDIQPPAPTVAEQLFEARGVLRGGDDQNVANARQHQGGQRVINHRLVVHRQQLLGNRQGRWVQTGAGTAG